MASKTCISCLRTVQRQTRTVAQSRKTVSRAFTTTSFRNADAGPISTMGTAIPAVTPEMAEGGKVKSHATFVPPNKSVFDTYTAYGMTELLYKECASQADYTIPQARDEEAEIPKDETGEDLGVGNSWWHTELGLKPTFSTWSQVSMLHMYLLQARFRNLREFDPAPWQQHLINHFFYDAEDKMTVTHNIAAKGTRNTYLKDLFINWRGLLAAYDEGISKGDPELAAAIWRNIFKADQEVDITKLALVTSYIRRLLKALDEISDHDLVTNVVVFGNPQTEAELVKIRSPQLTAPFVEEPTGASARPVAVTGTQKESK